MDPVKKLLCLDFDGVLHSYSSGWQGALNIPDPPVEGAQEFMAAAAAELFIIVIVSSRCEDTGGAEAMARWLRQHNFPPVWQIVNYRPAAFVTLDDRAITFEGKWPQLRELVEFQPWWQ